MARRPVVAPGAGEQAREGVVKLRPRDLPDLRREVIGLGQSPMFSDLLSVRAILGPNPPDTDTRSLARSMQEACALQEAELFYVDERMCDLLYVAAESLPEFRLELSDPPSRDGYAWLSRVLQDKDAEETWIPVRAVSWRTFAGGFYISIHVERDSLVTAANLRRLGFPAVFPLGAWEATLDGDVTKARFQPHMEWVKVEDQGTAGYNSIATLKSLWLMMRQPLAQEILSLPNRTEKRQAARAGYREPPPVRVVQLRRPPRQPGQGDGGSVEWHHQWIVRGHWRNQAFGEGRKQRRPVWISPHVKGPEGAPMLGGEKVYVVNERDSDG